MYPLGGFNPGGPKAFSRIRVRGNGDNLEAYGAARVNWPGFGLIPPGGVIEDVPLDAARAAPRSRSRY